jgi:hypothetical protein
MQHVGDGQGVLLPKLLIQHQACEEQGVRERDERRPVQAK